MAIQFTSAFIDPDAKTISFSVEPIQTRDITYKKMAYREFWITSSCEMAVTGTYGAEIWMCGGGGGGRKTTNTGASSGNSGGGGGGGGFVAAYSGQIASGAIVIGAGGAQNAAGGQTSINMPTVAALTADGGKLGSNYQRGGDGGSGGGAAYSGYYGKGQGVTTVPFGDAANFTEKWCAGGGGGAVYGWKNVGSTANAWGGGVGGSNGGSGGDVVTGAGSSPAGGAGGAAGGGKGGNGSLTAGSVSAGASGAKYGAGGGGGGAKGNGAQATYKDAGKGYQGIVIIRVPLASLAAVAY
jgi:hypothetical protein